MFKSNKGFTLVELIVVIAILAILAGVAVPAYTGYIEKAQDAKVITELDAIATAAQVANAEAGEIYAIEVEKTQITVYAVDFSDGFGADFKMFFGGTADAETTGTADVSGATQTPKIVVKDVTVGLDGSYATKAVWYNGTWTGTK